MSPDRQKIEARLRAKHIRKALAEDPSLTGAASAMARFAEDLSALAGGGAIAGYFPKGSELDVRPLMERLRALGHEIALPVMQGPDNPMAFRVWKTGDGLQAGPFGIQEPGPDSLLVRPVLVLAPMLAFDRMGWRLGYGGGYYDRTLDRLKGAPRVVVAGIAYAGQEIQAVPHDTHDQKLDCVVTETELIRL